MPIYEKNLSVFLSCATPVDREGWLNKRGEVSKGYQRRWFVLKGNVLFYFEKKNVCVPAGLIILERCTIELAEDDEQFSFKVMFHGPNDRSYVLGADSQEDMEMWMKVLSCATHDYVKDMVAELQRKLDEIKVNPETVTESPRPPPRQRHNPFNNQSQGGTTNRAESSRSAEKIPRNRISFRELHYDYGRSILKDFNEWRHNEKAKMNKELRPK